MAGPSWLVDSNRIATKIRSASGSSEHETINWKSNPTKTCPKCQHIVDNSDVGQEWPGLPKGVKFDPSDQEIIWHLLAKSGIGKLRPHPFIDEFIPTVDNDDGICYAHPQNLPGVKQDGSVSHFFHRAIKAYNTGTRKRRKINGADTGDVRWHKTGRTKPVILDGAQRGCKKIMVLYASLLRGGKPEKTNWVMHQYHLGTEEEEKDGEYVISKIFYQQQQQTKLPEILDNNFVQTADSSILKVDPVTPSSAIPVPPRAEKRISNFDPGQPDDITSVDPPVPVCDVGCTKDEAEDAVVITGDEDNLKSDNQCNQAGQINDSQNGKGLKFSDSMSKYWLDSEQLMECMNLCDDLFQSQSPTRDVTGNNKKESWKKPHLSEYYANLGPEDLKKDLQDYQDFVLDPANIETDTPDDFRLSQLDFGSQSSFLDP